mgnify:CR=1 FL=1
MSTTKIILKFKDIPEKDQSMVLDWLTKAPERKEIPYKVFLHKGGVNNPMEEVKNDNNKL